MNYKPGDTVIHSAGGMQVFTIKEVRTNMPGCYYATSPKYGNNVSIMGKYLGKIDMDNLPDELLAEMVKERMS